MAITGVGFGSKPQAAAYIRDGFEGGFNPVWGSGNTNDLDIARVSRNPYSSSSAHLNFTATQRNGYLRAPSDRVAASWYIDYWFYLASDWSWGTTKYDGNNRFLSNIKFARFWSPQSGVNENFVAAYAGWTNSLIYNVENVAGPSASARYIGNARSLFATAKWHHVQVEYAENSKPHASDGRVRLWLDGRLLDSRSDILTREDFAQLKRPGVIGFHSPWVPNSSAGETDEAPNNFYIDDVVVDTTWQRVEIGNQPDYAMATHREVQPAVTWSDSSITFTAQVGSFSNDEPKYVYVIDANGNASRGFRLGSPPPPLPTLAISDAQVREGNAGTTRAIFTVRLSAASSRPVSVAYLTDNGSAIAGQDFAPASGTLTFSPGETAKTVTVDVVGDTNLEPDENFFVRLSSPTSATIADAQGAGIILNDDAPLNVASKLRVVSVVASGDDGNVPANTLDGNFSTRWSAKGDGQWIRYDLGAVATVDRLQIASYLGNQRTQAFDIQVSTDGSSWRTVFSGRSSGTTTGLQTFDFADMPARFVRIVGHGNSQSAWNSLTEVVIWGYPPNVASKLAVASVVASGNDGNVPANTLDGNFSTRWSAKGDGQWIRYDLGAVVTVGRLQIASYLGNQRTQAFDIQVSTNGTSWTNVFSGRSSGTTTGLESFYFVDVSARYVRIVGHGNSQSDWNSLTEVAIWGRSTPR